MTKQTIKEYLLENLETQTIIDIVHNGISGGINGFIYYSETCAFHDEHENEIWNMLDEDASSYGLNIPQLIADFNGSHDVGSMDQLKNLLCWYAVERTANEIYNEKNL